MWQDLAEGQSGKTGRAVHAFVHRGGLETRLEIVEGFSFLMKQNVN
jgi:hypothetical protein